MPKYEKNAAEKVERAMHERKRGTLKSGSGRKVTSRKQAIAIGLSEARQKGAKVARRQSASRGGVGGRRVSWHSPRRRLGERPRDVVKVVSSPRGFRRRPRAWPG